MVDPIVPYKGRGAPANLPNRFERFEDWGEDDPAPRTQFFTDRSRSVIAANDSPDVGFDASVNPYRGCEHGCIYCYARPTHEYAGFSAGLDFESKILVKRDAPALLRKELSAKSWKPKVVAMSGVTDCYQPVERRLRLTRACLEVLAEFRNPVCVTTKNRLVTRDLDILQELNRYRCASVGLSITTLRQELAQTLEPRTSMPRARLEAVERLAKAGIPVGVLIAPLIPGLTDHEMPGILQAARDAGAGWAGFVMLRLPWGVAPLFERWLDAHAPESKAKVLHRVREMRGGKLYESGWGTRQTGSGEYAARLAELFTIARRKAGYAEEGPSLSTEHFRRPSGPQLELALERDLDQGETGRRKSI